MQNPNEIAKQVLHDHQYSPYSLEHLIATAIQRYGDERAARECERCARLCRDYATMTPHTAQQARDAAFDCALAIRATAPTNVAPPE